MGSTDGTQDCTSKTKDNPYGDCTKEQYRALDKAVGTACKSVARACREWQDCDTELPENLRRNQNCVDARRALMMQCFNGGDDIHKKVLNDELANVAKCQQIINQKCKQQPNPEPNPVPVPTPAPEKDPNTDPAPAPPPAAPPATQPDNSDPGWDSGPSVSPALVQQVATALGITVGAAMVLIIMGMIILSPVGV